MRIKFIGTSQANTNLLIFDAISSAYGVQSGEIFDALNNEFGGSSFLAQSPGDVPRAYLNYVFFDRNYANGQSGFVQVSSSSENAFSEISATVPITEDGFLFVFLSNETSLDANVYFDDFKITHTSSASVLQADPTHRLATR